MIDRAYRDAYATLFREALDAAPPGRYDEMALPSYTHGNAAMSWLFWQRLRAAFALAGELRGRDVLDFGCGGGVSFRHLHAAGARISGCDPYAAELAQSVAQRLGIAVRIERDLGAFAPRSFDTLFALDVLEHLEQLDGYLARFADVLRPGGRVILSGPTENTLYKIGRLLAGFSGHYHVRNIYDIERAFTRAGFRRERLRSLYFPATLFRVSAWRSADAP